MEYLQQVRTRFWEMIRPVNTIATAKVGGHDQNIHPDPSVPPEEQIDKPQSNDQGASSYESCGKAEAHPDSSIPSGFVQVSKVQFHEKKSVTTIIGASGAAVSAISHKLEAISSQPGQQQPQVTVAAGHAVVNKDLMKDIRQNMYRPTPYRPTTSKEPDSDKDPMKDIRQNVYRPTPYRPTTSKGPDSDKDLMKDIRQNMYRPTPYRPTTSKEPASDPKL